MITLTTEQVQHLASNHPDLMNGLATESTGECMVNLTGKQSTLNKAIRIVLDEEWEDENGIAPEFYEKEIPEQRSKWSMVSEAGETTSQAV